MNKTTTKRIEQDPIGLDKQCGYFYENHKHQVFLDKEGNKPALCDECKTINKVDKNGYFYCPNDCYGSHNKKDEA